jgi:predicted nucleic acid-binding Zn ribbon protein
MRRWAKIVGPELAKKSQPDRFDQGTLWVAVINSVWAQELRMQSDTILRRLAEEAGDRSLFEKVRFGVRSLEVPAELIPVEEITYVSSAETNFREFALEKIKARKREEGA